MQKAYFLACFSIYLEQLIFLRRQFKLVFPNRNYDEITKQLCHWCHCRGAFVGHPSTLTGGGKQQCTTENVTQSIRTFSQNFVSIGVVVAVVIVILVFRFTWSIRFFPISFTYFVNWFDRIVLAVNSIFGSKRMLVGKCQFFNFLRPNFVAHYFDTHKSDQIEYICISQKSLFYTSSN